MVTTLEELVEPKEPPSPPIFQSPPLDDATHFLKQHDDLTLDGVSRFLMEEDTIDQCFQEFPNHSMLLEVQQPFAEILSDSSSFAVQQPLDSCLVPERYSSTQIKDTTILFNGKDPCDGSMNMHILSSMAFLKGMEEANKFLPGNNGLVVATVRKNKIHRDKEAEVNESRRNKKLMLPVQSHLEEETMACEMLDKLMLDNPYEAAELLVDTKKENKAVHQSNCRNGRHGTRQYLHYDLQAQLICCAQALSINNRRSASELLEKIKMRSSPSGDATQRLAHYFAEGLEARLAGKGNQFDPWFKRTSVVELIKGLRLYTSAGCFMKVAYVFSNKTICNAVAGKQKLHIVDYGINDGFQWPSLLRWMVDRVGGPPKVRITAINSLRPECVAERTEEAGRRLSKYASLLGVPFNFHANTAKPESIRIEDLNIDPDEVLIVNNMFHLETLMDESLGINKQNPRDLVLNTIRNMKPHVFIHNVINGSYNSIFFETRFREALYNLMAEFDAIDANIPPDDNMRLVLERDIFARYYMNIITCEGTDRIERPQNYKEWHTRNQRAGLRLLPLDSNVSQMLKDKVNKLCGKHFMINEDHGWLLQGWKGRVLYALSTWQADDGSIFYSAPTIVPMDP